MWYKKYLRRGLLKKEKKKLHRGGCLKFKAIYQSKSFLFFEKKKKKSEESIKD